MKKRIPALFVLAVLQLAWWPAPGLGQALAYHQTNAQLAMPMATTIKLRDALLLLKKQYGVDVVFEEKLLDGITVRSDLLGNRRGAEQTLAALLQESGLRYKKLGKNTFVILVKETGKAAFEKPGFSEIPPASLPPAQFGSPAPMDEAAPKLITLTGRVTQADEMGLPGVNVALKGTVTGTITDAKGDYKLTIADDQANGTLVFSSIGYIRQEVPIRGRTVVNFTLAVDTKTLNEVVVVGYGTVRKSDLTGSVASISESELKKTQLTSLDQGLQGRAPGVQVTQTTGQPGGGIAIRVRGSNSITGNNEPLYVIDGFPIYNNPNQDAGVALGASTNPMATINPNDIASIEVLKDASATAIYGARGANGVVIITTKRGQSGKAKVDYEGYFGMQQVIRILPVLNARQYAELINDARENAGVAPYFAQNTLDSLSNAGTDWQRQIFRNAPMQSHQLTVSGGNELLQYAVSGNYLSQQGTLINSGFNRGSIRLNLDAQASKILKVGSSILFSQTDNQIVPTDASGLGNPGAIWSAQQFSPLVPVTNPDGTYFYRNIEPAIGNPVAYARSIDNKSQSTRFLGSLYAELTIAEGLTFKINGGQDYVNTKENLYIPSDIYLGEGSRGQGTIGVVQLKSLLLENTLSYKKEIKGIHRINALLGYTTQSYSQELVRASSQSYPTNQLGYNDLSFGTTYLAPTSAVNSSRLASYLGRINYGFKDRYLFTGTVRVDGSTRFGAGNKYGVFPSGSVAWRVLEEPFANSFPKALSDLKVRLSYGLTGNQEIGLYRSLPLLGNFATVFGNGLATGIAPSNIPNPALKWEATGQFDIGLDVSLLNNRVTMTADYYRKRTRDLLLNVTLPLTSGYASTLKNVGQVSNEGWELGVTTINVDKKIRWTTTLNLAGNRNKVLDLGAINQFLSGSSLLTMTNYSIIRVGEPIGSFYGRINEGIFQNQAEIDGSAQKTAKPGDRRYKDLNNDGIINDNDRTAIGNAQPKIFGSLTNTISYRGVELSLFLNGVIGNKILNVNRFRLEALGSGAGSGTPPGVANNSTIVLDRWTPANPSRTVARANTVYSGDILSTYQIEDGSFLRVKNITLAYNLPASLMQRIRLRTVRLYASGQNLLTLTKYTGYDPEVSRFGQSALNAGIDFGGYPIAKMYTLGLNVGL